MKAECAAGDRAQPAGHLLTERCSGDANCRLSEIFRGNSKKMWKRTPGACSCPAGCAAGCALSAGCLKTAAPSRQLAAGERKRASGTITRKRTPIDYAFPSSMRIMSFRVLSVAPRMSFRVSSILRSFCCCTSAAFCSPPVACTACKFPWSTNARGPVL